MTTPTSPNRRRVTNALWLAVLMITIAGPSCCGTFVRPCSRILYGDKAPYSSFLYIINTFAVRKCSEDSCEETYKAFSGSGFVVSVESENAWVLTAGHLCATIPEAHSSEIIVTALGGKVYPARTVHIFSKTDVCILLVENAGDLYPAKASFDTVKRGERVFALGAPIGLFDADMLLKFEGFYSGTTTNVPWPGVKDKIFPVLDGYSIPSRPGSSGGPIFNKKGEVIGMMIMARPFFETFTLSPPQDLIRHIMVTIKKTSRVYRAEDVP